MKFAECNENQKRVWRMVQEETNNYIGGLENTMMDYEEGDEEYQKAKAELQNFEGIKKYIRSMVFGSREWRKIDNLHFVTTEWVEERIDRRVRKSLRETREYLGMDTTDLD